MTDDRVAQLRTILSVVQDERDLYRLALMAIRDYDSFGNSPIAPRPTPTENRLRAIAEAALTLRAVPPAPDSAPERTLSERGLLGRRAADSQQTLRKELDDELSRVRTD